MILFCVSVTSQVDQKRQIKRSILRACGRVMTVFCYVVTVSRAMMGNW